MQMYATGIEDAPNTTYLSMCIRQAMNRKEVQTLNELQNVALLAELTLSKKNGNSLNFRRNPSIYSGSNYGSSYNRPFDAGSRSSYSKFSTPSRVNHVETHMHDTNDTSPENGEEEEQEIKQDAPSTEDDISVSDLNLSEAVSDVHHEEDEDHETEIYLSAIKR